MTEDTHETSWLDHLSSLPAVIAVLGVLAYAALRYGYTQFYAPLGVLPDEVGIGYAQVLAYAGPSLLLLLLGGGVLVAAVLLFGAAIRRPDRGQTIAEIAGLSEEDLRELKESLEQDRRLSDPEEELQRRLQGGEHAERRERERLLAALVEEWLAAKAAKRVRLRRTLWLSLLVYAVLALAFSSYVVGNLARERADDALEGRTVVPIRVLGMELLYLRAVPAVVRPTDTVAADALAAYNGTCVLYLGAANGTALFVTGQEIVLRVPDSAVVFETSLTGSSCRDATS